MSTLNGSKFYEQGNFDLITQKCSGNTYTGELKKWNGMVTISVDFSQTETKVAADDDPSYVSFTSPLTGTGTLTLVNITVDEYKDLFGVEEDKNQAVLFGGGQNPEIGLSFKNTLHSSNGKSLNKMTFNKVKCTLPNFGTTSISEAGTEIRTFEIPISVNIFKYVKTSGLPGEVTCSILNSEKHSAIWEKVKDLIYVPDMDLTALGA